MTRTPAQALAPLLLAACAGLAALPAAAAPADTGDWIVRGRATRLDPRNHDTTGLDLSILSLIHI